MDRQTLFKGIYLFRDATNDDLASLVEIAAPKKYVQGEVLFNGGDEADAMFVVEMGTVDIVPTGKELAVVTIGSGQTFGEIAFFSPGKRPASARAREMSSILRIPFDRLEPLLAERPALAMTFYRNACRFLAKHVRTLLSDLNSRYFQLAAKSVVAGAVVIDALVELNLYPKVSESKLKELAAAKRALQAGK